MEEEVKFSCQKHVHGPNDIEKWINSRAYDMFMGFIEKTNERLIGDGKITNDFKKDEKSKVISGLMDILAKVDKFIDETPLMEKSSLQRFGNPAYRVLFDKIKKYIPGCIKSFMEKCRKEKTTEDELIELSTYFTEGWGNQTRIDYGSGHEASFVFFLTAIDQLKMLNKKNYDYTFIITKVFRKYLILCRKIQKKYRLEPAGSHGCWGLDDFQFLPYLWGAGQLLGNKEITPADILDQHIHKKYKGQYLYFEAIAYILDVKRGPFYEHSSVLNSLKGVKTWKKINGGMFKMYIAEVLKKFVVIQHCLFGKIIPFEEKK